MHSSSLPIHNDHAAAHIVAAYITVAIARVVASNYIVIVDVLSSFLPRSCKNKTLQNHDLSPTTDIGFCLSYLKFDHSLGRHPLFLQRRS